MEIKITVKKEILKMCDKIIIYEGINIKIR